MAQNSYPHKNHRQRVRDSYRKNPLEQMPDRSLIELLLFYAIPRKDTNPIAGELISKYGSLANVLNVPYDELIKTEGMGEGSALLLSILPEISKRYVNNSKPVNALFEMDELYSYVSEKFLGQENEVFMIICLDPVGRAIDFKIIAQGSETSVIVDKRTVLETAFNCDADSVIIAHNHPNGEAAPSKDDILLTKEIGRLLMETGIKLIDHIIVGNGDILSLAQTEKFYNLFE